MTNGEYSDRPRPGRCSGIGGWLLVLVGSGALIGIVPATRDNPEERPDEKERPFAQAARDDQHSPVWSLAFSPDDTRLASATVTGEVWLKDLAGGQRDMIQRGPMGSAQSLAFSKDGRAVAVAGFGQAVRLLDAASGEELTPLQSAGSDNAIRVAFSRDGKYLATGGFGGVLTLWDWASRRRLDFLGGHRGGVTALDFSPDGSVLAAGDSGGLVKLWDVVSGKVRTTFRAHLPGNSVTTLTFSPDGALLATASYMECTVRLWDPSGREIRDKIPGTASGVRAMAFSPDGAHLALARGDGTASLWGIAEVRELGSVRANERGLQSVAFSGDGRVLATGGTDGCVRLWDVAEALSERRRPPGR